MEVNSSQIFDKKQVLNYIKIAGNFFVAIIVGIYEFAKEFQAFVKRVNDQSKLIEEMKLQDIEIENLKQQISILEVNSEHIEALNKKIFECQCNIVLLQRGRKVLKLTSS